MNRRFSSYATDQEREIRSYSEYLCVYCTCICYKNGPKTQTGRGSENNIISFEFKKK